MFRRLAAGPQTLFSESCVVTSGDLFFFAEQLVLRFSLKLSSDETDPSDRGEGRLADERDARHVRRIDVRTFPHLKRAY